MTALDIRDRSRPKRRARGHRASNDAVRTLAVLAALIFLGKFDYRPPIQLKLCFSAPRGWPNFLTRRITSCDDIFLPDCITTPRALATRFAKYQPIAVLISSRSAATRGVQLWWLCLSPKESWVRYALEITHYVLKGKQLAAEKVVAAWIKLICNIWKSPSRTEPGIDTNFDQHLNPRFVQG